MRSLASRPRFPASPGQQGEPTPSPQPAGRGTHSDGLAYSARSGAMTFKASSRNSRQTKSSEMQVFSSPTAEGAGVGRKRVVVVEGTRVACAQELPRQCFQLQL